MPPVAYARLKDDQKCIYQAFEHVYGNTETGAQMGEYVNRQGIDADDDAAVHSLAQRYGLNEIEMFLGEDWNKGNYNLEKGCEYVLTINAQSSMIKDFKDKRKGEVVLKGSAVKEMQTKYAKEVGHAVYCKTKKINMEIDEWLDFQKIYKKPGTGFPDNVLVVAYGRKRTD